MDNLDQNKLCVIMGVDIKQLGSKRVEYVPQGSAERFVLDVDSVIVAGEAAPDLSLSNLLKEKGFNVYPVGDCSGYGLIVKAVREAAAAAIHL